jgi:hypothetical protein
MYVANWNPSDGIEDPEEMKDDFTTKKMQLL